MPQVRVHIRLEGEYGQMLGAESVTVDLPGTLTFDERTSRAMEVSELQQELCNRQQEVLRLDREVSVLRWQHLPWWRRLFGWLPS